MNINDIITWLQTNGLNFALKILIVLAILIFGFWLSNILARVIGRRLEKTELSISLRKFFTSLIGVLLKIGVFLVALGTAGIQTTVFVAAIGGIAIGVGMALQGSLSNLAGGLLILFFKPYKVGDFVEALDKSGVVDEISVLHTVLITPDRRTVILPNGAVFNNPIINFSKEGIRRVDIGIGIGYEDNFSEAQKVLYDVLKNEELLLDDMGYTVEIAEFGDSSVNLAMNGYCNTENYLKALFSLNKKTKEALDAHGFNIPFPQRDVHILKEG